MSFGLPWAGMRRFLFTVGGWRALAVAVILLAATWLTYAVELSALEERSKADASSRVMQLATSYQDDVSSTFTLIDNILRFISVYDAERGAARTVELVAREQLYRGLVGNIAIVNKSGDGTAVGPAGLAPISIGHRQYFRLSFHTKALVIGKPVVGHVTKRLAIPFARAVHSPDRHAIGAITAVVDVASFAFGYGRNDFGPQGVLEIVGTTDRVIRARATGDSTSALVGRTFSGATPLWKLLASAPTGSYWLRSPLDANHTLRVFAYRRLPGFPVFVFVGLAYDDIKAQTAGIRRTMLFTAVGTSIVIFLLLAVWRQQQLVRHELRVAKEDALAGTRAKSLFLANMSHEIRTPMNGVIGMTDLALRTSLTTEQRDFLNKIDYSAKSLLNVINDILDFSKIEAGKLELETVRFDLAAALDNIVGVSTPRAAAKGLRFEVRTDPSVPSALVGDPVRYQQILLNLVTNAIKFTEAGSVLVTVDAPKRTETSIQLRTTVQDTGIGIDAEARSRLFQSFSQADNSITRRFGGTGLGLAISKALAERMGGEIGVESSPRAGSSFTFTVMFGVPLTTRAETRKSALQEPGEEFAGKHVLIAEDNAINFQIIERVLRRYGVTADVAANGREAVDKALAPDAPYDAVFMDVQMPEMDGLEATRLIRRTVDMSRLPIIAMTAHAMEDERRLCLEAGMNDHVAKPIDPTVVRQKLRRWIGAERRAV